MSGAVGFTPIYAPGGSTGKGRFPRMTSGKPKTLWERIDPGTIVALLALVLTQLPSVSVMWVAVFKPRLVTVSFPNSSFYADQTLGHSSS